MVVVAEIFASAIAGQAGVPIRPFAIAAPSRR
jgi:hypothetical protein